MVQAPNIVPLAPARTPSTSPCTRASASGKRIWVLVKEFCFSYHNKGTMLFTTNPYYGTLNTRTQACSSVACAAVLRSEGVASNPWLVRTRPDGNVNQTGDG